MKIILRIRFLGRFQTAGLILMPTRLPHCGEVQAPAQQGGGNFMQVETIETLLINGPNNQYDDPSGIGGNFSIGFLSVVRDDKLALTLNSQNLSFITLS